MPERATLRIFISSPSDVRPERLRTEQVIRRLAAEFTYHFAVEAVLWEREPLVATHHFQAPENIPQPRGMDVVVVILWSRLGVPLPEAKFRGAISGRAVTGTEWEFEDALAAARERGTPDLLLYRKTAPVTVDLDDDAALEERRRQRGLVQDFLGRWFRSEDRSGFTAASHNFETAAEFEEQLYEHLRGLLERRAGAAVEGVEIRWHEAPFRGLLPFEAEHAAVFFGRTRPRNELRELLSRQEGRGCAFVLVLGASGSGKSSLVRAGLLPDLKLPGMIGRVALVRHAVFRPSNRPEDLVGALAAAIVSDTAVPELTALHYPQPAVAALLRDAAAHAMPALALGLGECGKAADLAPQAETRLLLIVDQLEELFTLPGVNDNDRVAFVSALGALARSGLIWVVATMRSDFYDRLERLPVLAELAPADVCYRLLPPDSVELGQIIRQPAREAGLTFELDPHRGVSLDEIIRQAASQDPNVLPLLSFLLDQLWQRRTDKGQLTFQAYEELGQLEGALGRRAEEVFAALSMTVQAALPRVLRALLTMGQGARATVAARPAPLDHFPEESPERALIAAFLDPEARLLVADEGEDGSPRVRVAHEALLTHWERAAVWIADRPADLQLEERIETEAARWDAAADIDKPSLLRSGGLPLNEAEDLLARRRDEVNGPAIAFIEASSRAAIARQQAERQQQRRVLSATAAGLVVALVLAGLAGWQWTRAATQRARAEHSLDLATQTANALVFDLAGKFRNLGLPAALVADILDRAQKLVDQLVSGGESSPELRRSQANALVETANTLLTLGDVQGALAHATRAQGILTALIKTAPNNTQYQFNLGSADYQISSALHLQGDDAGALTAAHEALAIYKTLVAQDPNNTEAQYQVMLGGVLIGHHQQVRGNLSDALAAYRDSLNVMKALAAKDPNNSRWESELAGAYGTVADALIEQGDLAGGLAAYREDLAIMKTLTTKEPNNTSWRQALALTDQSVGGVLRQQGDASGALASYRESVALMKALAESDPDNTSFRRFLELSDEAVGRALEGQGDLSGALITLRDAAAIATRLVNKNPGDTQWQSDLSTLDDDIGDVLVEQRNLVGALAVYREAVSIVTALVAKNPDDTNLRSNLSAGQTKVGDVLQAQHDIAGALSIYRDALATLKALTAKDPSNTQWQRQLVLADGRVAVMLEYQGDFAGAQTLFHECLEISTALSAKSPGDAVLISDVVKEYLTIGSLALQQRDLQGALAALQQGEQIALHLQQMSRASADVTSDLASIEQGLARTRQLISSGATR
jgi:tetratricopeptide (TPR) repeat protein